MISLLIVLLFLCCWKMKFNKNGKYNDYMSQEQTIAIRGIFACIIFASHLRGYITLSGAMDSVYNNILSLIGQCMVSVFFFYSGYGIMQGYKNKKGYEQTFLKKRLFFTWFHFIIAVMLYQIVNLLLDIHYPAKMVLLSFTGWESVGNSNWFMFDTFLLYIFVWLSFKLVSYITKEDENKQKCFVVWITIFTILLIFMLHRLKETWWYDTLLCFPLGVLYSRYQEFVNQSLKSTWRYSLFGLISILAFSVFYKMGNFISYNVCACFFVLTITWFTMKFKIHNKFLNWLGVHSFYIYIYMRIPMIILSKTKILAEHRYLFAIISLLATLVIAWIMAKVQKILDGRLQQMIMKERK